MKRTMIALVVGAVVLTGCSSISEDASQARAKTQTSQVAVSQAKAVVTDKAAAVKAKVVAAAKAAAVATARAKAKAKAVAKAKARAVERARVARAEARGAKRAKARASVHDFTSCVNVYGNSSAKCVKYSTSGTYKKPNMPNCAYNQGPISGNGCSYSANGPDNPGYVKQCETPGVPKYQWKNAVNGKC